MGNGTSRILYYHLNLNNMDFRGKTITQIPKFVVIVKRSDLNKIDQLESQGRLRKVIIKNEVYCLEHANCVYIWPAKCGYASRTDGWIMCNTGIGLVEDIMYATNAIIISNQNDKENVEIIINEDAKTTTT